MEDQQGLKIMRNPVEAWWHHPGMPQTGKKPYNLKGTESIKKLPGLIK